MSRTIVRRKPATAECGSKAGEGLARRLMCFAHQSLALTLSGLLIFQPMVANAQSISASTTAPVANQPSVGAAPNGAPLIDIVTPNAAGLSHNKYDNFSVGTQGAILNNFKGEVGISNLGGATPGNPNINASNPASVILNEVTSGNRSALNGPTEVFGTKADVIIANPNGITCNGCGFINTPHATLTTGVPNIGADGSLSGFTVNGGDVTFEGTGGYFAAGPGAVDLFDVVSRNIHVNGPVYGKTLRLTAGASNYNYATGQATALTATSGTPEYAIDGTALGAMQADRIKMVVTAKGAGVNMSGDMAANAGDLTLSADGKISIGNASARQGVSITSKSKVSAAKVTSKAKVAIQADQGITLQSVAADDDIALSSGTGLLSVTGDVNSATNVVMMSAGGISGANVTAGGATTLSASAGNVSLTGAANSKNALSITAASGAISAASLLTYDNIGLNAGLDITIAGTVFAQGKIAATGRSISTGATVSGLDIAATQADVSGKTMLTSSADLQLTATGGTVNAASLLSSGNIAVNATSLTAQTISGQSAIKINATGATAANGLVNVSGQILGGSDIAISGASIQATTIASGVDFTATDAAGGNIALGTVGTLDLTVAGAIDVDTLLSAGDLTAQANLLQANNLTSHCNVDIDGGVDVTSQLLSAGAITINGNANGVSADLLASGVDFAATKAAGTIVLRQGSDLRIDDSAGAIQAGTILAAGAINAVGQTVAADTITGHKDITLAGATGTTTGSGRVDISGQILGGGNVSISGSSIAADAIVSGVDIAATDAAGGTIVLGATAAETGNLTLAASGALSAGTLLSAGDLTADGTTITSDNISAHGDMTLGGAITVTDQILGSGKVHITGQRLSAQTLVAGIDFDATNAAGGTIVLGQAGDLTVAVSGAVAAPTIQAAGNLDARGASITADAISGHKDISLSGAAGTTPASGGVDVSGQVLGGNDVTISGSSIKAGAIVSSVDFAGTAAANGAIVQTTSGDLTLASTGMVDAGTLQSAGALSATGATVTADSVTAHGDMTLGGAISVSGQILGSGNVLITGQSLSAQTLVAGIDFDATKAAGGNIVLGQAGDLTVSDSGAVAASTIQAAGVIDISGATVTADAITGHKDISLSGATKVSGQILGGGDVNISGSGIKAGTIVSGVDFAATSASSGNIVLAGSGDLTLASTGNINAGTLLSAGDLSAAGVTVTAGAVTAHGDVTLGGAISVSGQILGSGNISITGQSLSAETVIAGIDFNATDAADGNIALGGTGDLTVSVSGTAAASTIQAAGAIDVNAAAISADAITGRKGIDLSGTTAGGGRVDVNGQVLGGGNIDISGSSINAGTVVSGIDFAATAAANGNIVLARSGDLSLVSNGNITADTLLSAGDLSASGTAITADSLTAHGDVTLSGPASTTTAGGRMDVSGQILASGNVLISGQSLFAQTVVAGIDFAATDAAGGNIVLGRAGDLMVSVSGGIAASTIQAAGAIGASGTTISADAVTGHKNISLSGATTIGGQVLGGGEVSISGSSIKAGTIVSGVDFAATSRGGRNIVLAGSGDLTLASTGAIGAATLLSAGDLSAAGSTIVANAVTAHGDVTLDGATSVSSQILGAGNVLITGESLSTQTLVAGIDFDATNASGGNIVLGQTGDLTVSVNAAVAASTLQAAGVINASGATITADAITAHKDITLAGATGATTASRRVDVSGQVLGGNDISIAGSSIKAGAIVSGVDFARTAAAHGAIVQTASGDLTLSSTGDVDIGTLLAAGALNASGTTVTADSVTAHGDMMLGGAISVSGQILGSGDVSITGQSLSAQTLVAGLDFDATDAAGGNIVLGQAGDLTVSDSGAVAASTIQAAGIIDARGDTVTADAITGHMDISLSGATKVNDQVLGSGDVNISGSGIKAGTIVSGVDFAATSASSGNIVLAGSGDLTLASIGNVDAGTLLSAGDLSAAGSTIVANAVTAHGDVTLAGATSITGQILGAGNISITGQSLSAQTLVAGIDFDATNASGGNIVLGQTGDLTVNVSGGAAASTIQAAGAIDISGATLAADAITGHKDITLAGATGTTTGSGRVDINGQVLGGGNVGISGSSITAGAIVSGVDFAATAGANGNIVLANSGDLTLTSVGNINTGTLLSAGDLSATGSTVTADAVTAHGDVTLGGAISVHSQILGAGNVLISGQSLSAQTVVAGIDFGATNASGGDILLGPTGDLTVMVGGNAAASTMQAAGAIDVSAATVTADAITGHKDITLSGATIVSGQVLGGSGVSISGPSITAGAIVSGVDFARTATTGGIVQTASGDVLLTSTGDLTIGTLLSAGDFTAQAIDLAAGSITSHGAVDLKANGTTSANGRVDVSGQVLSASNLSIDGGSLNAGLLVSGVDFAATNATGGNIALAPSGDLNLTLSGNVTAGTILSAGDFTATAADLQAGSVTSHGKVGITGDVDVTSQILAAGDLTLNGGGISAPVLISGIDFAATTATGGNIVLGQSGAMNLTASGDIVSQTMLSAGDFTAQASDLQADSITSHGKVAITASGNAGIGGNVDVANQVLAAGNLTISGGGISAPTLISGIDFAATNTAGGNIVLGSSGSMNLIASAGIATSTVLSAGTIDASAATITAGAVTAHGDVTLAGSNSVNVTGQLLAADDVALSGQTVQVGQAVTGVDFAATARSSNGAIALGSGGDLDIVAASAAAGTLIVAGSLDVTASAFTGGNVTSHGAVAIGLSTNPGAVAINGQLLGASYVSITGSGISGNVIVAGVDFAATSQSAGGNIVLGQVGDLTLKATSGNISTNSLIAAGSINANAANNVSANTVAHGDLSVNAGNAITLSGQSLTARNVNLAARSITINTLVSGVDFAATGAAPGGSLMLQRGGAMTLAASSGSINANVLLSGGSLAATATQNIGYASLQSLGNATLTAPGTISYTSTTRVGGNLTLNTGAIDLSGSRGSAIAGAGTLIVNASSANLAGSNLVFGGLALNLSGGADLSNAQISTVTNAGGSGDIAISAAGLATTAGTSLLAAHDLTLNLPSLANTGQLAAGNNLAFNVAGDFYNSPSGLVFAGNNANLFVGGVLTNDQGALLSGNGLAIAGPGGGQRNGAVVNYAGLIQSGGSMSILTNGLTNTTTSGPTIQRNVQISNTILSAYDLITRTYGCETRCGSGSGDHEETYGWTQTVDHLVNQIVTEDQLISGAGASAKIRAGSDLTINAINLTNAYSSIKSDGNMLLTVAGTLTNDGATLNRTTQTVCDSSTPCQYYPDVVSSDTTAGGPDCSGPNRPCLGGNDPSLTYSNNPNGQRDASRDLAAGTTVTIQAIGAVSGVIQARGALAINGGGAVNNVAANGSIAGQVAIDAPATASNPLGALSSMTAGGALFNVNAALASVAANGGASVGSGPSLGGSSSTIGSGPAISGNNLTAGAASISGGSLTANASASVSVNGVTAAGGGSINGGSLTASSSVSVSGNGVTAAGGASISGGSLTANGGASVSSNSVAAVSGPSINSNSLTTGGAAINPNSLMGKLTAAVGNTGNLAQVLQVNGAQLASLSKPQSGGVGGTVPGQVFLFETRAAFLDVSKFYGSAYFIDRIGYTPETQVPFLGDAYFDNQLVDEQMRQLVGDGLGAGSFIPGDNATDQMKTLLDNGVIYAEANGLALGQALTPEQAASLTQSIVVYQAEVVDGAQVLVPVVYLSAADRAKVNSAGAVIAGNTVSIDAGSVDNSGAIAAADGMTINATDIKANGGAFLAGGNMSLNATNGITLAAQTMNIGGETVVAANGGVTAGGNLKMDAGAGSLTLSGTKVAAGGSAELSGQNVTLGAVKQDDGGTQALIGTTVTTGGNLSIAGTSGVNIIASSAKVGGDLSVLSSSGSVNIISAGVENTVLNQDRLSLAQGGTITTTTSQIQQGSSLIAGGGMLVSGNQGVLIAGSTLAAGGNLGIVSTNGNIAITAAQDQTTSQAKTIAGAATGYQGGSSSSTSVTSNGSSITSANGGVTVEADNGNLSVIGSDIAAKGGTATVIAKGDITIGEATDSASSSSQSGSKKASDATTTAEGSSISGQTGVNIASTGGNVTISASDVTAGDAAHTADANIQAAGNIIVASGKDTDEATSDSKSSGFLSSSKTHTHSYDEDTVGSSISASGNVSANAGNETVISGSNVTAGNNLSLSGSTVTVMAAEEEHESDKQTKKSGIGVGSGGGFISIYGSKDSKNSQSETDSIGSTLSSGGATTITSTQGDVNIFGSSSHSGDGTVISSARDVNIAPGAEEQSSSSDTKRSGFGINFSSGNGSVSVGIGVGTSEEKRSKDANINAVSSLDSDGGITIAANRNINDQSGQIAANGAVDLIAGDSVNMLASNDVTNASEMQKKSFSGVSITVSSQLISAAQSGAQAASLLSGDNSVYGIAPAVLASVNGYNAISQTMAAINAKPDPDTGLRPAVASISLTAGYSFSESSSESTTSIPVPPTIRGSSVTIVAESGDVVGRGVQISAGIGEDGQATTASDDPNNGNVLISAAGNVDLESVQATSDSKSSSKAGGVSIGVAAGIDAGGNILGGGPTANASYSSGKETGNSVTQVNSNVSGTNTVTVVSGDTLTLAGGVLSGNTVNASAASGIVIESRQDIASYDEKTHSAQLGISSGGISGGYNQGTITGDYANVSQQSGIFAGSGGYHVGTDGTIELVGGFIGSSADLTNNDLTANQILYSNIENSMSASSSSYGFSLIGAGIPVPVVGQPAKQDDHGETFATITPGNWNLTNQQQDLASLNADASKASDTVDAFDIDKLKAQQESAAALSQLANMAIGSLANQMHWDEGTPAKIALHAAAAALVAQLAGGDPGQAVAAAAAEELINGFLTNMLKADPTLTAVERIAIQQWAAAFIGAAIGGNGGAAAAIDTFKYNFLTHEQLQEAKDIAAAIDKCEAALDSKGCSQQDINQLYLQKSYYLTLSQNNTKNLIADCAGSTASTACQEGIRELRDFLKAVSDDDLAGLPTQERAGAFAVTQSIFVYDRILGDHLQGVLDGTATPDQALADALSEMSKLQGGVAAFLDAAGVVGGGAACAGSGGVVCALGILGAAGAANHLYGDAKQAITGEAAKSILELALENRGYTAADAAKYQAYVDAGILIVTAGTVGGQTVYSFAVDATKLGGANSASRLLQGVVADADAGASQINDVALELKGVSCSGGSCTVGCSFDGSTLVKTVDGFTAIRDIQPGRTKVWSRDDQGNEGYKLVLHQFLNRHAETVYVTLQSEKGGHQQTITTTLTHPFFAVVPEPSILPEGRQYRGPITHGAWVAARDLEPGQKLLGADGSWTDVVGVRIAAKPLDAYNLTVAGFHTYFVKQAGNDAAEPVWVHNTCTYTPTISGDLLSSNNAKYTTVGQTSNGNPVYYSNGNYFEFNGTAVTRIDPQKQGIVFQNQVLQSAGIPENKVKIPGALSDGSVQNVIPDAIVATGTGTPLDGVTEAKFYNATTVRETNQLTAQMSFATTEELPYNLVVGPKTVVDTTLQQTINELPHGGNIYRFDPATGIMTRY
ncbi:hemagglutinin repeat-containing protein [Rhizobium mayense]|uniref:Hemagglutinin repeat-containing protein n=1 Tax=Rhizobium mayense TaxID=1312184 RepID=A0ABT7K0L8_9HYPH|nr:hemagglutinin repeat-containing protein [Rhizobium mayense]MDL2400988.1 hemagglutinin repeat-containing protein [Rhizobium mayense]